MVAPPSEVYHALTVFGREGYAAASVEDIAQESGVAATAVYYHFGGKEELLNQALRTALDRMSDSAYAARARHAARLLASRVMAYTVIVGQQSRLDGGPLSAAPERQIVKAIEDVCVRIVTGTADPAPKTDATPPAGPVNAAPAPDLDAEPEPAPESASTKAAPTTPRTKLAPKSGTAAKAGTAAKSGTAAKTGEPAGSAPRKPRTAAPPD